MQRLRRSEGVNTAAPPCWRVRVNELPDQDKMRRGASRLSAIVPIAFFCFS